MSKKHNPQLVAYSQELRRNMTPEESHLWYDFLVQLDVNIKRQAIFDPYIVDFYIPSIKLAIELDGRQHSEQEQAEYDEHRDAFLGGMGITVFRCSNEAIHKNFGGICTTILHLLGKDE